MIAAILYIGYTSRRQLYRPMMYIRVHIDVHHQNSGMYVDADTKTISDAHIEAFKSFYFWRPVHRIEDMRCT